MALLDVSEVISDPAFTTPVCLVHREERYDADGNPYWGDTYNSVCDAVVTSDQKQISRQPEELRREGAISVRYLVGNAPHGFGGAGYDGVIWRGRRFVVKSADDYSQFGAGFCRLICWPEEASDGSY